MRWRDNRADGGTKREAGHLQHGGTGFRVTRRRWTAFSRPYPAEKYTLPVLILTARDTLTDKIAGLDVGADDYLVKPFALEELHARIRALLRRHNNQGESELIVGNLTLNMGRRQVWMGGEELILTPKEYALLSRLMLKAGSPVHREILYNDIYNWDNEPSTNTTEVHIHNLRDKVGKARIRTVRGFGYMLVANEEN